jgi:protein-S-isoprenylcysteine O-methyltransferase Ste14
MEMHSKLKRPLEGLKVLVVWGFAVALAFVATPTVGSLLAAAPLIVAGLLVRAWAAGHLERNKELTTSGPYSYVRDPLYVGRLLLLCGLGVIGHNAVAYALAGAAILVFFLDYMPRKMRKETARLEKHHGERYVQYRRQVRSLIPRLRPYPAASAKKWSPALFWRENREQWLMLAVLLLVAIMAFKGLPRDGLPVQ